MAEQDISVCETEMEEEQKEEGEDRRGLQYSMMLRQVSDLKDTPIKCRYCNVENDVTLSCSQNILYDLNKQKKKS